MKRLFDILLAATGLVLLSPLFALIALWIKCDSRGPVFFRQVRVGRQGKPFRIYKFRTMVADAEKSGYFTAEKDSRVTRSGRFQSGRVAATDQHSYGRDERRWTAADAAVSSRAVHPAPAPAARGAAGRDGLGAGERAQHIELARPDRT